MAVISIIIGKIYFDRMDILKEMMRQMGCRKWRSRMKIEIQNLCKTIKKVPILQDITVTFESGKIYGLKGKNGSGKTMLMRAISGLIIPNSGTINIDGEILGKDISFPRSIGF